MLLRTKGIHVHNDTKRERFLSSSYSFFFPSRMSAHCSQSTAARWEPLLTHASPIASQSVSQSISQSGSSRVTLFPTPIAAALLPHRYRFLIRHRRAPLSSLLIFLYFIFFCTHFPINLPFSHHLLNYPGTSINNAASL